MDHSNDSFVVENPWLLTCCQRACPVGTDVSAYLALIAQRRFAEALAIVREENPFPGTCGRVCDHPCQVQCRRAESDQPVAVRALKRFLADYERTEGPHWPERIEPARQEKVAIVGAGPAGLTAASDLLRHGFEVTVFEALPQAGGMMRYGIPDYRLPAEVLDFDLEYLRRLGTDMELNTALGREFTLGQLKDRGYAAVLLATGAHGSQSLTIAGVDLPGVAGGIDFLRGVELGGAEPPGRRVVVIGGGDVAMDTARTALRLGAEKVALYCLESRDEMPAHEWETREALDEQIEFHCGWGPVELIGKDRVRQVRFIRCTGVFDESGKFAPGFDRSQSVTVDAETVLVAIGQVAAFAHEQTDGIEVTDRQLYRVDPRTLQTSADWVFAAGDAVTGTATVIGAVASGHRAATAIGEYLQGRPLSGQWTPVLHEQRTERVEIPFGWEELPPAKEDELVSRKRVKSFAEVKLGLTEAIAIAEAGRCLRCDYETQSYTYSRIAREEIYHAARDIGNDDNAVVDFLRHKLSDRRKRPRADARRASFDDLVFLPANLTRLVIDPYREKCKIGTTVGPHAVKPLDLAGPIILGGMEVGELDETTLTAFCNAAKQSDIALRAGADVELPREDLKVIRLVDLAEQPNSLPGARAVELAPADLKAAGDITALRAAAEEYRGIAPGILVGICLGPGQVVSGVQAAVEAGMDFATLNAMASSGQSGGSDWNELTCLPRIDILNCAVQALRDIGREEDIDLIYFGCVRGGGDMTKALALGAKAVMIGQAALIAAGPACDSGDVDQREQQIIRFVQAMLMESSILARGCGKTYVQNLEPEDLRSLTVETCRATGLPLVGSDRLYCLGPTSQ